MRILVTGGTRGLGRAIVEAVVARDGGKEHTVYLGCRSLIAGHAVAKELGDGVEPLQLDVTDAASIAAAAASVGSVGQLDALVNNAGVLLERDGTELQSIVESTLVVNMDGARMVTEAILPLIRDGGHIINVSSGAGTRAAGALSEATRSELDAVEDGESLRAMIALLTREAAEEARRPGDTPVYGLSKACLNYYTKMLARQTPRVRVNACSPGFCRTEIAGPDADYSKREPKERSLGADVVVKLLFGELGAGCTGRFYKECSKPGTPLEKARSAEEAWIAA